MVINQDKNNNNNNNKDINCNEIKTTEITLTINKLTKLINDNNK